MRIFPTPLLWATALSLLACGGQAEDSFRTEGLAPLHQARPGLRVDNDYLVKLKQGATANDVVTRLGLTPKPMFDPSFNFFAASLNDHQLQALRADPAVDYVEEDQLIYSADIQLLPPSWGLDMIDGLLGGIGIGLPVEYHYNHTGAGVKVYILDTGINLYHTDFGGRTRVGMNYSDREVDTCDRNGHGSHVAGIVGGTVHGVAKQVTLVSVKVLSSDGTGLTSWVVNGLYWVAKVDSGLSNTSVINISLGGSYSRAVNDAVSYAYSTKRIPVIVAAGNEATDACTGSPSSSPGSFTVGAIDRDYSFASYSNYGPCVDMLAPGTGITSTWKGNCDGASSSATHTLSGTSMAAAHVTGVAALLLSERKYSSAQELYTALKECALKNRVTGLPNTRTPNLLSTTCGK